MTFCRGETVAHLNSVTEKSSVTNQARPEVRNRDCLSTLPLAWAALCDIVCPRFVDIRCYFQALPMLDIAQIRTQIERDVFDYQQLISCLGHLNKPRDKIRRLLSRDDIVRIKKGLYTFGEPYRRGTISRELLANLIYGPSYVSLDYALSYHGLIPERVETVTSVTTGRSHEFETPFGTFAYRRLCRGRYAVGAILEQKGRDWYDLVCYAGRYPRVRLSHLEARMRQSGDYDEEAPLSKSRMRQLLMEAVGQLDVDQARAEVAPFVRDKRALEVWSKDFFYEIVKPFLPT